ncbi:hypothetical protein DM02DRAFT_627210 [Periconia macrospinosa]|uniref:Uncharacterized protein n=1 Tax=Periconia macrospinosa TaxID=97972 RepID=A0A2V1DUN8_9PLEO|nr:hypothetical protein DM02DRAFT_627210 [Periconia macrospinosa]
MISPRKVSCSTATTEKFGSQSYAWDPYAAFEIPRQGKFQCKGRNGQLAVCGHFVKGTTDLYDLLEKCEKENPRNLSEEQLCEIGRNCLCTQNHRYIHDQAILLTGFFRKSSLAEKLRAENRSLEAALSTERDNLAILENENEKLRLILKHTTEKLKDKNIHYGDLRRSLQETHSAWKDERQVSRELVQEKEKRIEILQGKLQDMKLENDSKNCAIKNLIITIKTGTGTKDQEGRKVEEDEALGHP